MTRSMTNNLANASARSGLSESLQAPSSNSGPIWIDVVSCVHANNTDSDSSRRRIDRPHVLMMSKNTVSMKGQVLPVNHWSTQLMSSSSKASILCDAK